MSDGIYLDGVGVWFGQAL